MFLAIAMLIVVVFLSMNSAGGSVRLLMMMTMLMMVKMTMLMMIVMVIVVMVLVLGRSLHPNRRAAKAAALILGSDLFVDPLLRLSAKDPSSVEADPLPCLPGQRWSLWASSSVQCRLPGCAPC